MDSAVQNKGSKRLYGENPEHGKELLHMSKIDMPSPHSSFIDHAYKGKNGELGRNMLNCVRKLIPAQAGRETAQVAVWHAHTLVESGTLLQQVQNLASLSAAASCPWAGQWGCIERA